LIDDNDGVRIYWHRELPPQDAEAIGEHVLEAVSERVSGGLNELNEQWGHCFDSLMSHARKRLGQEVFRLGGTCAHVLKETIEARHNDVLGEAWLYGRFEYMLRSDGFPRIQPATR